MLEAKFTRPDNIGEPEPEAPTLTASLTAGNIRIAWPTTAQGYTLHGSALLGPGALWTPVASAPVVEGDQSVATVPAGTGNQFFRLQK